MIEYFKENIWRTIASAELEPLALRRHFDKLRVVDVASHTYSDGELIRDEDGNLAVKFKGQSSKDVLDSWNSELPYGSLIPRIELRGIEFGRGEWTISGFERKRLHAKLGTGVVEIDGRAQVADIIYAPDSEPAKISVWLANGPTSPFIVRQSMMSLSGEFRRRVKAAKERKEEVDTIPFGDRGFVSADF